MRSPKRRVRTLLATAAAAVLLGSIAVAPVGAITNGSIDTDHPYVGLMTAHAEDGDYLWRCSGTLLSPTVFITAGHCTEAPAAYAVVFFSDELIVPDPDFTLVTRSCVGIEGYPCGGANELAVTGSVYTHPDYDPDAFFLADLGMVVLDDPVVMDEYGALPTLDQLESLQPRRSTTFTSVGFGLQKNFPPAAAQKIEAERIRMVSHPHLLQINTGFVGDFSILLSNNANTGGTCNGDSGGPDFIGTSNVLAGVTSYGLNPTCAGTGGVYRIDRADDLDWIATFFD